MPNAPLKPLTINFELFKMAASRDVDYHDVVPTETYLDLHTGAVDWSTLKDEDADEVGLMEDENNEARMQIASSPARYLLIPGLTHGEQHNYLGEFLASPWTLDKEEHQKVRDAYFGKIGEWKKIVGDEIYYCFRDWRDARVKEKYTDQLRNLGIEPQWS